MSGYYAAEGQIAREPIEGGIEITREQYKSALEAVSEGRLIAIREGAFALIDPPEPEPLEIEPSEPTIADYQAAAQALVHETARSRQYDSAVSLASYVASTAPAWAAEAAAFVAWRDAVWLAAYAALDAVEQGGTPPSVDDFVASLPSIVWPD